jgi:hypothetical protein
LKRLLSPGPTQKLFSVIPNSRFLRDSPWLLAFGL